MLEEHAQPAEAAAPSDCPELTAALSDSELLSIRDRLEQNREQGDDRFDWLLTLVRTKITERARQACLDAEQQ